MSMLESKESSFWNSVFFNDLRSEIKQIIKDSKNEKSSVEKTIELLKKKGLSEDFYRDWIKPQYF